MDELQHYGVKGMKWGRRKQKDVSFHKESNQKIITNKDGTQTIPKGFVFNRVGRMPLDVNASGALYVSHGKADAARYIKSLGPTTMGKLLGTAGDKVQHISVKSSLKMASDEEVSKGVLTYLDKNPKFLDKFNTSLYSAAVTGDFEKNISKEDIKKALANPKSKESVKLAFGVTATLANPDYADDSRKIYSTFKDKGYDAIPDTYDILTGTSQTAMIVINPDKLSVTSTTVITKDVMKSAKTYLKSVEKLTVSDLVK